MKRNRFLFLAATTATIFASQNSAFADTKVYSPNIDQGELEIEWRGNYDIDKRAEKDRNQDHSYSVSYGFTNYWASEIYLMANNAPDASYKTNAVEWENRFQLTEQGKNFADVGLYFAYTKALESKENHDEIEAKILLEKQIGKFVNRANIGIDKELRQVGGAKAERGSELEIALLTKYSWKKYFEPGVEYHLNFNHAIETAYSDQSHQFGPAIYGKVGYFKYELGLLFSISQAAVDKQIKWNLEYEF